MQRLNKSRIFKLVFTSLCAAMCFVLGYFLKLDFGQIKLSIAAVPVILLAVLFGPVEASLCGLLAEFIGQVFKYGITATTFLWILPLALRGLFLGLVCKKLDLARLSHKLVFLGFVVLSSIFTTLLNTGINLLDSIIYGYSYIIVISIFFVRLGVGILSAIAQWLIVIGIIKSASKILDLNRGEDKNAKHKRICRKKEKRFERENR